MKRQEKNIQSRQKIVAAAMMEFGNKGYARASLNTICTDGGISKGSIYYYFKDRDDLFLACVRECYDELTAHLRANTNKDYKTIDEGMQTYFDARSVHFAQNPMHLRLFFCAEIAPPPHLSVSLTKIKSEFLNLNIKILSDLLSLVKLSADVSVDEVIESFMLCQDFLNTRYQLRDINSLALKEHEQISRQLLNTFLYGVVERV